MTQRIASAIGNRSASEAWRSTNAAVWPPTRRSGTARGTSRTARTTSFAVPPSTAPSGIDVDPPQPAHRIADRRDDGDAVDLRQPPRVVLDRSALAAADGHEHGTARYRREVALERVVDDPPTGVLRQHAGVDAGELDAQERDPHRDQQHGRRDRDRRRAPHHPMREPVPEALPPRLRGSPALQARARSPAARARPATPGARSETPAPPSAPRPRRRSPSNTGTAAGTRSATPARRPRSRMRTAPSGRRWPASGAMRLTYPVGARAPRGSATRQRASSRSPGRGRARRSGSARRSTSGARCRRRA